MTSKFVSFGISTSSEERGKGKFLISTLQKCYLEKRAENILFYYDRHSQVEQTLQINSFFFR